MARISVELFSIFTSTRKEALICTITAPRFPLLDPSSVAISLVRRSGRPSTGSLTSPERLSLRLDLTDLARQEGNAAGDAAVGGVEQVTGGDDERGAADAVVQAADDEDIVLGVILSRLSDTDGAGDGRRALTGICPRSSPLRVSP